MLLLTLNHTSTMSTGVGMSSCCLSGKVQQGKPTGREDEVNGIMSYIAEPADGNKSKTVIFLVDSKLINHCVADRVPALPPSPLTSS